MRSFMIIGVLLLSGCVSASTANKLCADLGVVSKVVSAVNENAGKAVSDYTPKKCVNVAVNGDAGKLTGGASAGISNE